jgi:hypothetical protein
MVGDMFNNSLKSKLDAVCSELAAYIADTQTGVVGRMVRLAINRRDSVQIGGPTSLKRRAQLAHRMTFSMQFSPTREDWQSKTAAM